MPEPIKGWAVADHGVFNPRTVGPTRRSALVNWLHLNVRLMWKWDSDEYIEKMWQDHSERLGATLHEVLITEAQ